ncbi:hypothetical protein BC827DRAFT_115119 [Russula dissimulans]|nr:hypothetical protein BC827DRAFT_115119 [Russula dissimulans]
MEGVPGPPAAAAPPLQRRARSPDTSIGLGELTGVSGRPCIQDLLVLDRLPQPLSESEPSSPLFAAQEIPSSLATSRSPLRRTDVLDELRPQFAHKQFIDSEAQLIQRKMEALATEAVVVVQQRGQLSSQQHQLSGETAKSASMYAQSQSRTELHGDRIALLEASLAEC